MSKNVRLSEEAYERLAPHERDDETFSDVVFRLADKRSLLELTGVLTDERADAPEAAVEERRERRNEELESIADERGGNVLLDTTFLVDPIRGDEAAVESSASRPLPAETGRDGGTFSLTRIIMMDSNDE
ncbi:antitoxin VapB family protein [Salinirubellus sp. GCM10025818]|uniref:antitoxin VapB family protein n=1 Tax=Salinirubellus TaxID=2162630 RepID=UPI0030D10811